MPAHTARVLGHLLILAASFSTTALAKTGTEGCTWHTTTSVTPQTTIEARVYYVQDTLEICAVDCENKPDAIGCRGPVYLEKDTVGTYLELRSPDDGDDDDKSSATTRTKSNAQTSTEPEEDASTILIMATAPTPVPPGLTGPVTSTPTADSAGIGANSRLRSAGFIVGVAMAIAFL